MNLITKEYVKTKLEYFAAAELTQDGEFKINGVKYKFNKGDYLVQDKETNIQSIWPRESFLNYFKPVKDAIYSTDEDDKEFIEEPTENMKKIIEYLDKEKETTLPDPTTNH